MVLTICASAAARLDPAAGAGRLHVKVQAVAVDVVTRRGGADEGGRERLVGMAASALGSTACRGGLCLCIHPRIIYEIVMDSARLPDRLAPDEFVGPALELAAPRIGCEQVCLQRRLFRLLGARLVHLLDHLEGQNDIADLAGLAVPDQFYLALVLKQQKAILVRQGFVSFDKTDDLLLFLISQSGHRVLLPPLQIKPYIEALRSDPIPDCFLLSAANSLVLISILAHRFIISSNDSHLGIDSRLRIPLGKT